MDPIISLLLGVIVGVVLGVVIGMLVASTRAQAAASQAAASAPVVIDPAVIEARHAAMLSETRAELGTQLASAQASLEGLRAQLGDAQAQYRDLVARTMEEAEQRQLAEREEARKRQAEGQAESKVLQALTPVQETLRTMQQKVNDLEKQRQLQHGELAQQLRSAAESEERLRATADSLASALSNNATRGVWGETQLRAVVESAGMLEHVNFDVQTSIKVEGRVGRPDMVVNLPGGKSIAVDSKVPFTSYLEAAAIARNASDPELARRKTLMNQHVKAVRDHVNALGARSYWDGLDSSPEMVVAFIPSESLLSSALEADPSIMEYAFSKHVALASPVTLFSVLKAVAVSWRHEVVTQEAKALFDVSRELYGRLTVMAGHVEKLGRSIERSVKDYNTFVGSLERQVLPSARRISQLDESKVLPNLKEVEEDTRQLTASDLTAALEAAALSDSPEPAADVAPAAGGSDESTVIVAELKALDETGIGRPELDLGLLDLPDVSAREDEETA